MAQSSVTVTPPNPTCPTNFASVFLGTTPPVSPSQTSIDDGTSTTTTVFAANRASVDNTNFPSVAAEGAGTEVLVTAPGSRAECPTVSVSCLGSYVGGSTSINAQHASSLSPATAPTLTSVSAGGASGTGNATCTATGTGFVRSTQLWINGIAYPTTYTSSTTISASAPKKATSGNIPVFAVTNGVATSSVNWVFT